MLEFTTKESPTISVGVTATVKVIGGTVAFGSFVHFLPRKE